jgi:hypothetical protein
VGREHKSNGIFIVASWSRGVFWQKCWDAECRGQDFRSNEMPIPAIALESSRSKPSLDDDEEWNSEFELAVAAAERNALRDSLSPAHMHDFASEWNDDLEAELQRLESTLLQRSHNDAASSANAIGDALEYDEVMEQELRALENASAFK